MKSSFILRNDGNASPDLQVRLHLFYYLNSESADFEIGAKEILTEQNGTIEIDFGPLQTSKDVFISLKTKEGVVIANWPVNGHALERLRQGESYLLAYVFDQPVDLSELPPADIQDPAPSFVYGRLIETKTGKNLEDVQVMIWAKKIGEEAYQPITSTRTEASGYFYFEYPVGQFEGASALVGLDVVGRSIPIKLESNGQTGGYFPKRVILAVELKEDELKKEDCGCSGLNLNDKKVLEEFSFFTLVRTTEPEIKGFVLEDEEEITLEEVTKKTPSKVLALAEVVQTHPVFSHPMTVLQPNAGSGNANATTGKNTDSDPIATLKSVKIKKSVLRTFLKNEKELNAENLPKLIAQNESAQLQAAIDPKKTKPLGRAYLGSENTIDWDHEPTLYQAVSIAHGHLLHFKSEWMTDGYSLGDLLYSLPLAPGQKKQIVVFDWDRRESASNTQSIDYEEGLSNSLSRDRDILEIAKGSISEQLKGSSSATTAAVSGGMFGSFFGISGGAGHSRSSAQQRNLRQTSASDMQRLRDRINQSANSVRSMRSTVIQTVSQGERFEVSSESVANYNHCHAMTIQYYEVLRHFKVRQRFAEARECLFVPLLMTPFDTEKALRWREPLLAALIDQRLKRAFDAGDRYLTQWRDADFPSGTFASEPIKRFAGVLKIKFVLQRPADDFEEVPDTSKPLYYNNLGQPNSYEKKTVSKINLDNWRKLESLLGSITPQEFYSNYLKEAKDKDAVFHRELGELISRQFVDSLVFHALAEDGKTVLGEVPMDVSLNSRYQRNGVLNLTMRSGPVTFAREKLHYLQISAKKDLGDVLPNGSYLTVESGYLKYATDHFDGFLFRHGRIGDDLTAKDGVLIYTGPTKDELRNPKKDDVAQVNKLLTHLNDNLEYYHKAIWLNMTPERRFMLLDGILLPSPKSENRSVASLVENQLVAIVGNSLVFPVAPGLNLDPKFNGLASLTEHYMVAASDPISISVPTKGVFAEAVMGNCNSCEEIDESRFWRWEESPIPDSPTAINPISTDTRRADPGNLQPQQLPNPIVNIQNAPNAPDPSGIASTLNLLGKGDSFRDVTGLVENQKNSLAAYQKSMDVTQALTEKAIDLEKAKLLDGKRFDKAKKEIEKIEDEEEKAGLFSDLIKVFSGIGLKKKKENPVENRKNIEEDLSLIQKATEQNQIDEEQGQNISEDLIRKEKGIEKNYTEKGGGGRRKREKKYNLTLLMRDFEGRVLEGSFRIWYGDLTDFQFDVKGSSAVYLNVILDSTRENIIQIKGNPYFEQFIAESQPNEFYWHFVESETVVGNNSNLTFIIQQTRKTQVFAEEEEKNESYYAEKAIANEISMENSVEIPFVTSKFQNVVTVTKSSGDQVGSSESKSKEFKVSYPSRRLKIRQKGVEYVDVDLED